MILRTIVRLSAGDGTDIGKGRKQVIHAYENGTDFLAENRPVLEKNLYLGVFFLLDAPLLFHPDGKNYALACRQGERILLALKTEPYDLLLFGDKECAGELAFYLKEAELEVGNYLCDSDLGRAFGDALKASFGIPYEEILGMDFMEAKEVTEPSSEEVEAARETDLEEICLAMERFNRDCGLEDPLDPEQVKAFLNTYRVVRRDGRIASMARCSKGTDADLRIACVYTRDEYRGQGLARKVVNTLKNEILEEGKAATLNVDRKNPISNHLYESLGFRRLFAQGEFRPVKTKRHE